MKVDFRHAQVTLPDGRVLVVSGLGSSGMTTVAEWLPLPPPCGTPTVTPTPNAFKLYMPVDFYNATQP